MDQIVYLNGALIPKSEAKISPFDHGFLYGYALMETMRAYKGRVFRLDRHIARMARSSRIIGINLAMFDYEEAVYKTLKANNLTDARIRITVSAGEGEITPDPSTCLEPTVFIVAQNYSPPSDETYQHGFNAIVSEIRQNSMSPLSRVKSANYLINILARLHARIAGADEALLLNEHGHVCEGSISNVFMISNNTLITPLESCGVLPGITREAVLDMACKLGISTVEREIDLRELLEADEAFITNSLIEIMPLTVINNRPIGTSKAGHITAVLMSSYKELVHGELELV